MFYVRNDTCGMLFVRNNTYGMLCVSLEKTLVRCSFAPLKHLSEEGTKKHMRPSASFRYDPCQTYADMPAS